MSATTPVNETPSSQNQSAASESSSGGVNTSAVDLQHPMKLTSSEGEEFIIPYKAVRFNCPGSLAVRISDLSTHIDRLEKAYLLEM